MRIEIANCNFILPNKILTSFMYSFLGGGGGGGVRAKYQHIWKGCSKKEMLRK